MIEQACDKRVLVILNLEVTGMFCGMYFDRISSIFIAKYVAVVAVINEYTTCWQEHCPVQLTCNDKNGDYNDDTCPYGTPFNGSDYVNLLFPGAFGTVLRDAVIVACIIFATKLIYYFVLVFSVASSSWYQTIYSITKATPCLYCFQHFRRYKPLSPDEREYDSKDEEQQNQEHEPVPNYVVDEHMQSKQIMHEAITINTATEVRGTDEGGQQDRSRDSIAVLFEHVSVSLLKPTAKLVLKLRPQRLSMGASNCILCDVSGVAMPSEVLVILGGSGCSKSTLLDALCCRLDTRSTVCHWKESTSTGTMAAGASNGTVKGAERNDSIDASIEAASSSIPSAIHNHLETHSKITLRHRVTWRRIPSLRHPQSSLQESYCSLYRRP